MKILTKEEEQEHYKYDLPRPNLFNYLSHFLPVRPQPKLSQILTFLYSETLKGGIGGGIAGLGLGTLGVYGAAARFPAFRSLTIPLRAFLITSSGTFAGKLDFPDWARILE